MGIRLLLLPLCSRKTVGLNQSNFAVIDLDVSFGYYIYGVTANATAKKN